VRRLHLEDAVADLEDRHVEGAASKVEHEDALVGAPLLEPVRERGSRRLVDDAEHLESGDLAGFLGRLALGVVEVRRHRDDGLVDLVAQISLGVPLQLLQHEGRDLLREVGLIVDGERPVLAAHLTLHGPDGAVGIGDGLPLGDLADEHLGLLGERDDGWCRPGPLGVGDNDGLAPFEGGNDRVRRPQVDTYNLGHAVPS
jgi:hypothetical protein